MRRRENSCNVSKSIPLWVVPLVEHTILVPFRCRDFFNYLKERILPMEKRIALIGIIVENTDAVEKINSILHEYGEYMIGRMGIPYPKRHISVISIIVDAPNDVISALSGKLGMIPHVNTKTVYSKLSDITEE